MDELIFEISVLWLETDSFELICVWFDISELWSVTFSLPEISISNLCISTSWPVISSLPDISISSGLKYGVVKLFGLTRYLDDVYVHLICHFKSDKTDGEAAQ